MPKTPSQTGHPAPPKVPLSGMTKTHAETSAFLDIGHFGL
jgi:hypothetical protein